MESLACPRHGPAPLRQKPDRHSDCPRQKQCLSGAGGVCTECSRPVRRRCAPENHPRRVRLLRRETDYAPRFAILAPRREFAGAERLWPHSPGKLAFLRFRSLIRSWTLDVARDRDRKSGSPNLRNSATKIAAFLCCEERFLKTSSLSPLQGSCQRGAWSGEAPSLRRECDAPLEFWLISAGIARGHRCGK